MHRLARPVGKTPHKLPTFGRSKSARCICRCGALVGRFGTVAGILVNPERSVKTENVLESFVAETCRNTGEILIFQMWGVCGESFLLAPHRFLVDFPDILQHGGEEGPTA